MVMLKIVIGVLIAIGGNSNRVDTIKAEDEEIPLGDVETAFPATIDQDITVKELIIPDKALEADIPEVIEDIPGYEMAVCNPQANFASYMDYRAITNTNSRQYAIQAEAYTNEKGYRELNGQVLIAMTSRYGSVGDSLRITFEDGTVEDFILGDIKAHTPDECSQVAGDSYSIIEIIVDTNIIEDRRLGKILDYSKNIIRIEGR